MNPNDGSQADFTGSSVGDIISSITSAASQAYQSYQLQAAGYIIGPQGQLISTQSAPVNYNLLLLAAVVVIGIVLLKK